MKHNSMKACCTIIIAAIMFLVSYACTEQSLTSGSDVKTVNAPQADAAVVNSAGRLLTKTVGAPISESLGNEWIRNYVMVNRAAPEEYTLSIETIRTILADSTCIGILFYYAIDNNNRAHIIPRGVNISQKLMHTATVTIEADHINEAVAQQWIDNYKGAIKAHYWGSNTLTAFINTVHGKSIRATRALNNDNAPQLLLNDASAANFNGGLDASYPCPPYGTN